MSAFVPVVPPSAPATTTAPKPRTAAERREFLDEVDAQNTSDTRERAYRYARKRVELLARCGVPVERRLAGHLLADALGDTYMGNVEWQPESCNLYVHLRSVMRYRVKDMVKRARKLPHERFGGSFTDDSGDRLEAEASGRSHPEDAETRAVTVDLAAQIAGVLYASAGAANDEVMTLVLDAYAAGITSRAAVADRAGISRKQYDNARDRINTLLKRLPEQLAADAAETLGRTG